MGIGVLTMFRRPTIPLTSADRELVHAWSIRVLAVWAAVLVATLAMPTLLNVFTGAAPQAQRAPERQCTVDEITCRRQAAR
jgi:hypothetical protein